MSSASDDLVAQIGPLRQDVEALRARLTELVEQSHYEDLDHAILGLRIVDHALEEVEEHSGLGGEIKRTPEPALHGRANGLAARLEQLQSDAAAFEHEHPNEDLETAITALEIARGSLHEVIERYEPTS